MIPQFSYFAVMITLRPVEFNSYTATQPNPAPQMQYG